MMNGCLRVQLLEVFANRSQSLVELDKALLIADCKLLVGSVAHHLGDALARGMVLREMLAQIIIWSETKDVAGVRQGHLGEEVCVRRHPTKRWTMGMRRPMPKAFVVTRRPGAA